MIMVIKQQLLRYNLFISLLICIPFIISNLIIEHFNDTSLAIYLWVFISTSYSFLHKKKVVVFFIKFNTIGSIIFVIAYERINHGLIFIVSLFITHICLLIINRIIQPTLDEWVSLKSNISIANGIDKYENEKCMNDKIADENWELRCRIKKKLKSRQNVSDIVGPSLAGVAFQYITHSVIPGLGLLLGFVRDEVIVASMMKGLEKERFQDPDLTKDIKRHIEMFLNSNYEVRLCLFWYYIIAIIGLIFLTYQMHG